MRKISILQKPFSIVPLVLLMVNGILLSSCNEQPKGFDGQTYDLSLNSDNSLTATINKIGGNYNIKIEGTGKTRNYDSKKKTPWYSIAKKIKSVEISDGITGLGENIFKDVKLQYYILPESLTLLEKNAFVDNTLLYSYAKNVEGSENYKTYYFSESMPTENNKYWHFVNERPAVWVVDTIKALFVGNSFTFYNDIPLLTSKIAESLGYKFVCDSVTKGAHTLTSFADPEDEFGKVVHEKLTTNNDYNYMILQEQSTRPLNHYEDYVTGATALKNKADATQKDCKVRLYETWGFESEAKLHNWTIPEMEQNLCNKTELLAEKLNVKVHYVGRGFTKVYNQFKDINLYHEDNKHPSYAGSYLSALIHVGSIFNCDLKAATFNGDLDEATAEILKTVANEITQ